MNATRTNILNRERSPYLLQHKDNPIAWRPWGEEAFRLAREEKKPIFLSVGYSTCHWCHVMAHESFEDREVADVLNEGFISIKVDREENPDVDQIYMGALQALSGGGGWPMSVWLTAEGKPFFAGTYFPKYRFLQLLRRIQEVWRNEPDKLAADADRLLEAVRAAEEGDSGGETLAGDEEFLGAYISHFQHSFDEENGGFGGAPKFPQTMNLMVMMRQDSKTGLRQAEEMVNRTLLKMVRGGIYDQLAGGFHRYSVDARWLVPHFEKMLYDQAMLTMTLIEAHQLYGENELARAARETLDYVLREMTHPGGGFYSAQDADSLHPGTSEMEEGYFCTYDYAQLSQFLTPEELATVEKVYGVTPAGNFEGRNILNLQDGFDGASLSDPLLISARKKLAELRASRPAPHLDDKIIASWNGLMIAAFARAGLALNEPRYAEAARRALNFARENLRSETGLRRFWRDGEARGRGCAEDYASLIHACLETYPTDFDPKWAVWALEMQKILDRDFWDSSAGLYFANDGSSGLLPLRPKDLYDGVHPCSNSMQAYNLSRLYLLTGESSYREKLDLMFSNLNARLRRWPSGLAWLALALDFDVSRARVAVMNGDGWVGEFLSRSRREFHPHLLWARSESGWPLTEGKSGGAPSIFVCENGRCLAPALSAAEVRLRDQ